MTAQETAAFMGHSSRSGFTQARSVFGECGAQMRVAESVNSRVADYIGGMVRALTPGLFATLGSLYSGCFDELGRGLSRVSLAHYHVFFWLCWMMRSAWYWRTC